ncbi:hypothetical protein GP2143_05360 [marine gamma proteobacterium HTCC2143]|uniref:Uncharacterized protein n=1 Tax=marine gamma proteobacterium HTCC2143 TaxID=247633 RepID=A0YBC2_9GAMM|nr:hypothetical protein GP2143_05360 [marine gamma proteobacterium HTCC2143]
MAKRERDEEQAEVNPVDLLNVVDRRVGINKLLMISALIISVILISVMATGISVMYMRISALTEEAEAREDRPMDEQFVVLEQQIMLLADFRKSELKKISTYTQQLEKISKDCDLEKAEPYTEFLTSREADFKVLVETMKSGFNDLASMNRGSKKWLTAHNKTLDDLVEKSVGRKAVLEVELRSGS